MRLLMAIRGRCNDHLRIFQHENNSYQRCRIFKKRGLDGIDDSGGKALEVGVMYQGRSQKGGHRPPNGKAIKVGCCRLKLAGFVDASSIVTRIFSRHLKGCRSNDRYC